jgi:hypothetical protein
MSRKRTPRESAIPPDDGTAGSASDGTLPSAPGQRPGPDDEPRDAPGRLPAQRAPDPVSRQGFDRQRLVPQDERPADVLDDENIAGEKDFEPAPPRD